MLNFMPCLGFTVVCSCPFPLFCAALLTFSLFCFGFPSLPVVALPQFALPSLLFLSNIRSPAEAQPCCSFDSLYFQQDLFLFIFPFHNSHNRFLTSGSLCASHCVSPTRLVRRCMGTFPADTPESRTCLGTSCRAGHQVFLPRCTSSTGLEQHLWCHYVYSGFTRKEALVFSLK